MQNDYTYRVLVDGKERLYEGHGKTTAESVVRGIMCWFTCGTIFTVIDPSYNISIFQKVSSPDSIKGYCELVNYIDKLKGE